MLGRDWKPYADRFWAKVRKTRKCWEWTGTKSSGYGMFRYQGRMRGAHRLSWELANGPIPAGLELDHLCRNRACVRPSHLEAVSPRENKMRGEGWMARLARQTHCKHGHPLSGDNLYTDCYGRRICRVCRSRWRRERYLRLGR